MELKMTLGFAFWFCRNHLHLGMLLQLLSLSWIFCKRRQLNEMIINSPISFFFKLSFYYSCPNCPPFLSLASPHHSQSPLHCLCPWVIHTCSLTRPFPFFPPYPSPHSSPLWSLSVCSLFPCPRSILLICLFCWLGSTYRWDHMVSVLHRLAYFT